MALLAGGLGTRLGQAAERIPKALVPVADRPFIDRQLELLRRRGVRRVVLCLGHLGEAVEEHLGSGAGFGLALQYSYDGDRLLGTGGALRRAAPLLGPVFWVLYGDSLTDVDLSALLGAFDGTDALGLMTVLRNEGRWDRSNVLYRDGQLRRYDKGSPSQDMVHIDYGVTLLRQEALGRIPPEGPYDVADLYRGLVDEGRMIGCEVTRRFYEIGSPEGLEETRAYFSRRRAARDEDSR